MTEVFFFFLFLTKVKSNQWGSRCCFQGPTQADRALPHHPAARYPADREGIENRLIKVGSGAYAFHSCSFHDHPVALPHLTARDWHTLSVFVLRSEMEWSLWDCIFHNSPSLSNEEPFHLKDFLLFFSDQIQSVPLDLSFTFYSYWTLTFLPDSGIIFKCHY